MTVHVRQLFTNTLATLHAPGKQAFDLLVVPNTVEDKQVKWSQAFPRAIKDHTCIELVL